MEKEKLLQLINDIDDTEIIKCLYAFSKDFIERHSARQIVERCSVTSQFVQQ